MTATTTASTATFAIDREDRNLNQYWYSRETIQTLVSEIEHHGTTCAFLSTPSLYFAINRQLRDNSILLEFDKQWEKDPGFVFFDFNSPEKIPEAWHHNFDYVIVDPPFITEEVWSKYATAVKLLIKPSNDPQSSIGGKVLFTSVIENHAMLEKVMSSVDPKGGDPIPCRLMVPAFRPSIPHLVYQYHCFVNYPASKLQQENPELPPEDRDSKAARHMSNDWRESQQEFAAQMFNRDRSKEVPLPAPRDSKLDATEADGGAKHYHPTTTAATGGTAVASSSEDDSGAIKWTRIPEGLTEYANGAEGPPEDSVVDPGPEYRALEARRNQLEQFKRQIDAAVKACEASFRPGSTPDAASAPAGGAELQAVLSTMKSLQAAILAQPVDGPFVAQTMDAVITKFTNPPTTKETLRELSADCTRLYKSRFFNRQKELLAEMKVAKAAHLKSRP